MRQKNVFGVAQNNPSAQSVAATSTIRPDLIGRYFVVVALDKKYFYTIFTV